MAEPNDASVGKTAEKITVIRPGMRSVGPMAAADETPGEEMGKLPEAQRKALNAIFRGRPVSDAARLAGVSRSTLYRWQQNDPQYRKILSAWRRQSCQSRQDRLRTLGDMAVNNVYASLLDGHIGASVMLLKILMVQDRRPRRRRQRPEPKVAKTEPANQNSGTLVELVKMLTAHDLASALTDEPGETPEGNEHEGDKQ
jgi:hypothetical protein